MGWCLFLCGIYTSMQVANAFQCQPCACLEGASLTLRQDGREEERKGGGKKGKGEKRKKKGKKEGRVGKERPLWKTTLGEF